MTIRSRAGTHALLVALVGLSVGTATAQDRVITLPLSDASEVRPHNVTVKAVQGRRNHATQCFSYPGYDFDRLRRESPAQYESYVDLVPGEWTHLRIDVAGETARFYVGAADQPVLIVRDLKRGAQAHGTVGLWVDNGTDGHFRNLSVRLR